VKLDITQIHKGLYQGSRPTTGPILKQRGFSLLVLCAEEFQPPAICFPGVDVVYAPNDDNFARMPTREELRLALDAARKAAHTLLDGGKVLSTCWMGHNRSGLVSGLTLCLWLGVDGPTAIGMIKKVRKGALRNPGFLTALGRLQGAPIASAP